MVSPGKGQSEQAEQLAEPSGIGQVRVLEVEAPALKAAEQGFDFPAPGVSVDGLSLRYPGAGNDEPVVVQPQGRQGDKAAPNRTPAWPMQCLSWCLITYPFQVNYPSLQLLNQGKLGNCKKTGE